MDRITKNLLEDFLKQFEIVEKLEANNFEKFCNYSIIKNEFNNDFNIEDISTGSGHQGIDGIGIIVNNQFITSKEELTGIIENSKILEVVFVFIQSKTSSKFEGSEIGNFIFSIKDFFSEDPKLHMTPEVKNKFDIVQVLFEKFSLMTKGNPLFKLYYVTTGKWINDASLKAVIDKYIQELKDLNLFEDVIFIPCGASKIQKLYRKTAEVVSAEFAFSEMSSLPKMDNVEEAYLGYVNFEEFKKIITDDNDNIKNIFYDNVRDYLGENPINLKIDETLKERKFDLFSLLNNGITIVADRKDNSKGKWFSISNYQVVNGCQTSHTLFNNRDLEGINSVNIPMKLIITTDDTIKSKITIATNSQTEIKEDQLVAFSDFQKTLELYYKSYKNEDDKLYYERRTGQYNSEKNIPKTKIVTIKNQIKTFASMFLEMPHLASGYYGKLYKNTKDKIFKNDHKYITYYLSSLALYKIEKFIRNGSIDKKYNKARYHILMIYRMVNSEPYNDLPPFNSKEIENFCQKLIDLLSDDTEALNSFLKAIDIIDKSQIDITNQKLLYQKNTTDSFINSIKN